MTRGPHEANWIRLIMSGSIDRLDGADMRKESPQEGGPERRGARRLVSPFRCRVWAQHSRPEEQLTEDACKSLRDSIAKNGQHQPALGRPARDDPDCDIEIVCGARRHSVARSLGRDLLVEVRDMTDAQAFVAMYEENLLREDDSPYVRAQILLRALRSHTYSSQEDLGRAFNLSHSAVSRLLMLAQLPSIVIAAFPSPKDIREGWGVELHRLWSEKERQGALAARARELAGNRSLRSPRDVYEALITPPGGKQVVRRKYRNIPVRGCSGDILFHERDQIDSLMYIIPKTTLSPNQREALKLSIIHTLESGRHFPDYDLEEPARDSTHRPRLNR